VVQAVSAAVIALALVAVALFMRDLRESGRKQECLIGAQSVSFADGGAQRDYVDALRECGYDIPDDIDGDGDDDSQP
jgi:hypothetical protein